MTQPAKPTTQAYPASMVELPTLPPPLKPGQVTIWAYQDGPMGLDHRPAQLALANLHLALDLLVSMDLEQSTILAITEAYLVESTQG